MREISDPLAQPQYTVAFVAVAMGLGALCLYGTPFISLYILSGRVYESVATVVSSWMGAMVGTGIEKYSAEAAAAVRANKQIYVTQVDAAGQIRNAGLEAKLRQAAAVIATVGREISREVGEGMRITC